MSDRLPAPIPNTTIPPAPIPGPVGTRVRSPEEWTTAELVRAARGRDPRAWAELVTRYQGMVHSVVRLYRLSDADRADTAQNTWLRALERLDSLREPDRLGGWLAAIARREALATLRRTGREVPATDGVIEVVACEPGPEAVLLLRETHGAVVRAVAALPPRRRAFVRALFYQAEPSYAEISRALVMPTGSIGPTRQRVLCTLRSGLAEKGFSTPWVA